MKITVQVTQHVDVEVDESKFPPEFMEEFRGSFFPFYDLDDHAKHLAQLAARGVIDGGENEFIEGYGPAGDMGIRFHVVLTDAEIAEPLAVAA